MFDKESILDVVSEGYYLSPKMIKFLLIENLTLKTILHEKGLLDPEDYWEHRKQAAEKLEEKAKVEIMNYAKQSLKEI